MWVEIALKQSVAVLEYHQQALQPKIFESVWSEINTFWCSPLSLPYEREKLIFIHGLSCTSTMHELKDYAAISSNM
jgi:hypothetical protein